MKEGKLKSLILAAFGCCFALCASAATSVFSNYGQIQNVQNYSSNPFWTPNSPYNQRMPQAIYAQGADLNTEDCLKVVQSLVSVQCMARDNCKDTSLSDIRPVVMVQLSNLPGHNYVSACAGYIDGVYESYVEQYGGNLPNKQIAFPTGTTPNPNVNGGNQIQLQNPYKIQPSQYQQEYKERSQELQYLQQQNGAGSEHLSATAFPETYADLSFTARMENATAGYEPYKDKSAYVIPNFKTEEEWCGTDGHLNSPECAGYKEKNSAKTTTSPKDKKAGTSDAESETNPLSMYGVERILPWFGILVVKKGSLDTVFKSDKPFISPAYMKQHKDTYFPANSDKTLGLARGCTHGNHTAHDKDVINRAAHITMGEKDSFFTGNDYYVYDGEDVYWGTAVMVGEIALAILTLGVSAEAETLAAANTAKDIAAVSKSASMFKSINLVKDTAKVQEAARAASAITKTSSAAEKTAAITKLRAAGVNVSSRISYTQLNKIGSILSSAQKTSWVSALVHGNKWRMVQQGVKNIGPTTKKVFGEGATIGRRLAFAALALGGVEAANKFSDVAHNIFTAFLKANGYSSATTSITNDPQYKDIKFNSFGLLSADNLEDHENDVSHGTWIQFDTVGEINSGDDINPGDAENEATRFAQEFAKDVKTINAETPLCDIDIYVVRPVIGDPFKKGSKDIYYLLTTDPTEDNNSMRVEM